MRTLSPRLSFWTAAAVIGLSLWVTAAPSVIYPAYETQWHLTAAAGTVIFAVFPITLVPVLAIFGNLSDYIGRRRAILLGLAAFMVGTVLFGVAPNLVLVLIGRVFMGVGTGLSLSAATAAMIEFGGSHRARHASAVTTVASSAGLALATLGGGALIQYAPFTLHLTYWVLVIVVLVVGVPAWFLPRAHDTTLGRWSPRMFRIPEGLGRTVVAGSLGVSAAYTVGTIIMALGAQVGRELIHSTNSLLVGAVLAISAVAIGLAGILGRKLPPKLALTVGPGVIIVGGAVFIAGATLSSLAFFIVGSALIGASYGLMFAGALGLIAASAPAHHRGAVISAAYLVGYLVQGVTAVTLGAIATTDGLLLAIEIGCGVILALAVSAAVAARTGRSTLATA